VNFGEKGQKVQINDTMSENKEKQKKKIEEIAALVATVIFN
jgi:hypothetical protein